MEECIAIIGAMDEEVEGLSQALSQVTQVQSPRLDIPIIQGRLGNKDVVVVRCGIGKVNAALATQCVIDHYNPSAILNSGVAGGLSPTAKIGDLVVGTASLQHDFDVRKFGYPRGVVPRLAASTFTADPHLLEAATLAANKELACNQVHQGLIVSGDQFISSVEQKQDILAFFPEAMCAEMEGAAIAQVASVNRIPHLIMRAISDQADSTAPHDFDQYLLDVIPVLNTVIQKLLALLNG